MLSLLFAICMIWFIGKFFIFGVKSILGNLKAALYSCIFPGDFDRNGCWRTDLYCTSIVDHRRNHCTYII